MFVCRLMYLISKFELDCSNNLIDMIIELNSDVPLCAACIESTTNLELLSKTMLDHLLELATRSDSKDSQSFPFQCSKLLICAQIFVHAAIKAPSALQTHQLQLLEPEALKKLSSTLHFHQPTQGRCHCNCSEARDCLF